jgi:mono/diheme cytochrome c family protein
MDNLQQTNNHQPTPETLISTGAVCAVRSKACARCHSDDGDRGPLYRENSHPIRVMVDFGYMPPNRRLRPEEAAELEKWLEGKDGTARPSANAEP